jgi:uncharacterized protein (DUF58 family)
MPAPIPASVPTQTALPADSIQTIALLTEAEQLAQALARLASGRQATAGMFGHHRLRRPGGGQEFWQYRRAAPGDPAALIDWRRSARGQALFVRERERDAPQSYRLLIDRAAGMEYTSAPSAVPAKSRMALLLALALACRAVWGHEAVAVQNTLPRRLAGLPAAFAAWDQQPEFSPWTPADAPPVTCQLLVTDALQPLETVTAGLRHRGSRGRKNVLLVLADPAEASFPFAGRMRFAGMTADVPPVLFGQAEAIAADYHAARTRHLDSVLESAQSLGWHCLSVLTDTPVLTCLHEITRRWDIPA